MENDETGSGITEAPMELKSANDDLDKSLIVGSQDSSAPEIDDSKHAEKAFSHIKKLFIRQYQKVMLDAGDYLVKEFYGNDYEKAKRGERVRKKSLHLLIKKLQEVKNG